MPDITMCKGQGCPQRSTCYRHIAKPNPYRQSYFAEPPRDDSGCDRYVEAVSKSQVKRLDVQTGRGRAT